MSHALSGTNLAGLHQWTLPIVNVILKIPIADAEFELLQELFIAHQIEGIEYIKIVLERKIHNVSSTSHNFKSTDIVCLNDTIRNEINQRRPTCGMIIHVTRV